MREKPLIVALPGGHRLAREAVPLKMSDQMNDLLIVFPKAPRPSFADQVLTTFGDRMLVPQKILEVRELQIAIRLVGAGQGIAIVPDSLQGMIRTDVCYRPIGDRKGRFSDYLQCTRDGPFERARQHTAGDLCNIRRMRHPLHG